jgi:hypothetical protein
MVFILMSADPNVVRHAVAMKTPPATRDSLILGRSAARLDSYYTSRTRKVAAPRDLATNTP